MSFTPRACLLTLFCLPALCLAHGGPGFQRPMPQSPLVGQPPTYIAPGNLPPTYNPPGNLPPTYVGPGTPAWAIPSAPPSSDVNNQFTIPSDPGLGQRNLLNEELRLRGWDQGHWRNSEHDDEWQRDRHNRYSQ